MWRGQSWVSLSSCFVLKTTIENHFKLTTNESVNNRVLSTSRYLVDGTIQSEVSLTLFMFLNLEMFS